MGKTTWEVMNARKTKVTWEPAGDTKNTMTQEREGCCSGGLESTDAQQKVKEYANKPAQQLRKDGIRNSF
jgi:hypothetical protein